MINNSIDINRIDPLSRSWLLGLLLVLISNNFHAQEIKYNNHSNIKNNGVTSETVSIISKKNDTIFDQKSFYNLNSLLIKKIENTRGSPRPDKTIYNYNEDNELLGKDYYKNNQFIAYTKIKRKKNKEIVTYYRSDGKNTGRKEIFIYDENGKKLSSSIKDKGKEVWKSPDEKNESATKVSVLERYADGTPKLRLRLEENMPIDYGNDITKKVEAKLYTYYLPNGLLERQVSMMDDSTMGTTIFSYTYK